MQDGSGASFDIYLVEDVILTLGNLRGSLGWLSEPDSSRSQSQRQAGLARIERQIDLLEDRARRVRDSLRAASGAWPTEAAMLAVSAGPPVAGTTSDLVAHLASLDPVPWSPDLSAQEPEQTNIFADAEETGKPDASQGLRLVLRSRRTPSR